MNTTWYDQTGPLPPPATPQEGHPARSREGNGTMAHPPPRTGPAFQSRPHPAPGGLLPRSRTGFPPAISPLPVLHLLLLTLLLAACAPAEPEKPLRENAILSSTAFFQDEQLFAHVVLNPRFMHHLKGLLQQGEPLLATYQFRIHRLNDWLPDTLILRREIYRHLRMRLITQRYELLDELNGLVRYATDEDEAVQFLGNPRFVLLHKRVRLLPGVRYRVETRVSITHEGMSRMFQFLDHWLGLSQPLDFVHHAELITNP